MYPSFYGLSYNEVEQKYICGSISDSEWRRYRFFWMWCHPRFGGVDGAKHDRSFNKLGAVRYYNRINRVRRWIGIDPIKVPVFYR